MSALAGALLGLGLQAAAALAVVGTLARCLRWARTPQARPVPLTPAPMGYAGVAVRVGAELVAFRTLWRASRLGWLLGWGFHAALALVLVDHLWLAIDPVPAWMWRVHAVTVPVAALGLICVTGLLARRLLDERVRYVSAPSDYLHLVLLASIFGAGLALRTTHPVDIGAVRVFCRGLLRLEWLPLPADPVLIAHLAGAIVLLAIFPVSKLLHAPGLLFSPSIAVRDRARLR